MKKWSWRFSIGWVACWPWLAARMHTCKLMIRMFFLRSRPMVVNGFDSEKVMVFSPESVVSVSSRVGAMAQGSRVVGLFRPRARRSFLSAPYTLVVATTDS